MTLSRKLYRLFALAGLVLAGALAVRGHRLACRLHLSRPERIQALAGWWYRRLLGVMRVRVDRRGRRLAPGTLVVANHLSWLDIPVLGSVVPVRFLSKAEVQAMPVVGWLARMAGTLFIQRGGNDLTRVRETMRAQLAGGGRLAFFPEGTTSRAGRLRPFHPRLFSAAIDSGATLVPAAIDYHSDDPRAPRIPFEDESFFNNVWRVLGEKRIAVTVTLLPALETAGRSRRELAGAARSAIAAQLSGAGPESDRPGPGPGKPPKNPLSGSAAGGR